MTTEKNRRRIRRKNLKLFEQIVQIKLRWESDANEDYYDFDWVFQRLMNMAYVTKRLVELVESYYKDIDDDLSNANRMADICLYRIYGEVYDKIIKDEEVL